jgi:hypothetical protein
MLLVCWSCEAPKRFLYAWRKAGHGRASINDRWACRACAGLSFASEGQYDPFGEGYPRPEPWNPYVFASPEEGIRFIRSASRSR